MSVDAESLRARIREICMALPGVTEHIQNPVHSGFHVNDKAFCRFLNDHHGDGVIGMTCRTMPGVQAALVDLDRERFYLPAYMARWGWVGVRLDVALVDWEQIEQLITEAYLSIASKALVKEYQARR